MVGDPLDRKLVVCSRVDGLCAGIFMGLYPHDDGHWRPGLIRCGATVHDDLCRLKGERQGLQQVIGFIVASAGMVYLLLPGLSAPPLIPAMIMAIAGISWGIYSLLGKNVSNALAASADNFIRASLIMVAIIIGFIVTNRSLVAHGDGILLACCSGAITSGIGYALWYKVLPAIRASSAATMQLAVPVLAALGGMLVLHEALSWRLAISSVLVLGGIAWYLRKPKIAHTPTNA